MRNRYRVFAPIVVIVTLFLVPTALLADVTGSILGVVRDPSKAVIKGARITVTNTETNLVQETVSAEDGSYRFLALPAGTYKLNATNPGFQQFNATDIVVKVNDQLRIDIALTVGNVKEEM
ncbi:MAG: carboxypeptidase-like regulatory domain-containing protein, partial [Candidatus Sulfotelmatobacter sp.]